MSAEEAYLDKAIDRYPPSVAAPARAALKKLRKRCPGAGQLVFERRHLLGIGFARAECGNPVFSVVLYPRWVRFFFFEGVARAIKSARFDSTRLPQPSMIRIFVV